MAGAEGGEAVKRKWLCKIGIHLWEQSRPLVITDAFPFGKYENPTRSCSRCGKSQWWLPGYGGSEFGCWCNGRRTPAKKEEMKP